MATRSSHFRGSHHAALYTSGPVRFLNPTTRYHLIQAKSKAKSPTPRHPSLVGEGAVSTPSEIQAAGQEALAPHPRPDHGPPREEGKGKPPKDKIYHIWSSRDNRKGRHAAVVVVAPKGKEDKEKGISVPPATNTLSETWKGIVKMSMRWPVWDISFDVAVVFTIGGFCPFYSILSYHLFSMSCSLFTFLFSSLFFHPIQFSSHSFHL